MIIKIIITIVILTSAIVISINPSVISSDDIKDMMIALTFKL
jgi:hypothetical protein